MSRKASRLKQVLRELEKPTLSLADLPEEVQRITLAYAESLNRMEELEGEFVGALAAEALLDVWRRKVRASLALWEVKERRWFEALLPVAQFIAPATGRFPDPVFPVEKGARERAIYRLLDEEWVTRLTADRGVAKRVVEFVSREYLTTSSQQKGEARRELRAITKTYHNWLDNGIESLAAGIQQFLSTPAIFGEPGEELVLPEHFVERKETLEQLKTAVLKTAETGGWVTVMGLAGMGKSTLLAALVRDREIQEAFPDGIAAVAIKAESNAVTLARRLAVQLGAPLPPWVKQEEEARTELQKGLSEQRVLLVVDDVSASPVLKGICDLRPGTVGVLTTRSTAVVDAMEVPLARQMQVGKMMAAEAWKLAGEVSERQSPEEEVTVWRVLKMLEYHPHAVRVAAARARISGWEATEQMIENAQARLMALGDVDEACLNVWTSLEAWWEGEKRLRRHLAILGHLPLLSWYDREIGMAIWQVSAGEAAEVWGALARMQLVEVLDKEKGTYRMHWLVWDFARQKGEELSRWERLRLKMWVWRYPLRPEWSGRWWKVKIPKPKQGLQWPWWRFHIPGIREERIASLWWWLTERAWSSGLRMAAGPEEWVMTVRSRWRFWGTVTSTMILGILGSLGLLWSATVLVMLPNQLIWGLLGVWVVILCLGLWAARVAMEEVRRVLWWRLGGRSCSEVEEG